MLPLKFKNLPLPTSCDLMCGACRLWSKPEDTAGSSLPALVETAKAATVINLCGGNPLLYPELPELLWQLKTRGHFVTLTTNGLLPSTLDRRLLKLIDLPIIYLPAATPEDLLAETGLACYEKYVYTFEYLQELKKTFVINYPATILSLESIPEVFELTQHYRKAFLWLTYRRSPDNLLQKESQDYLRYYPTRKKAFPAYLSSAQDADPGLCLGCFPGLETPSFKNLWFFISAFYKMYF